MAQQTEKPNEKAKDAQADGTAAARAEAARIKSAAEREAKGIVEAAEQEALKIKKVAEAEARKTRKATEAEARRTELANQAREAETREAEEAAREKAERLKAAALVPAAEDPKAEELPAMLSFAQDQFEAATKVTQAIWERNFELLTGGVPAYLKVYEQTVSAAKPFADQMMSGLKPVSSSTDLFRETAQAGADAARELFRV